MSIETYDWVSFWFFITLALVLFYQSWMNLVKKQLTNFSMDALMLLYLRIVRGREATAKAKKLLYKEPKRIRTLGIFALCGAFAALYVAANWYSKYLILG